MSRFDALYFGRGSHLNSPLVRYRLRRLHMPEVVPPSLFSIPKKRSRRGVQGPGKRILTFVVGGISRSELRVAHALAARTGRDITIGSTSIETPASFLQRVQVGFTGDVITIKACCRSHSH